MGGAESHAGSEGCAVEVALALAVFWVTAVERRSLLHQRDATAGADGVGAVVLTPGVSSGTAVDTRTGGVG